jgi:hypothetical protein
MIVTLSRRTSSADHMIFDLFVHPPRAYIRLAYARLSNVLVTGRGNARGVGYVGVGSAKDLEPRWSGGRATRSVAGYKVYSIRARGDDSAEGSTYYKPYTFRPPKNESSRRTLPTAWRRS